MKDINTLQHHAEHSDIPVAKYARAKHIELAASISDRIKIYLDTKYWVLFRDVILGRNTDPALKKLYEKIQIAVSEKKVICPLSSDIFCEVFSQKDVGTLEKTVNLIDYLSENVCMVNYETRVNTELYHFLIKKFKGDEYLFDLDQLVWTKSGYVFGISTHNFKGYQQEFATVLEKAMFDQMWEVTLLDTFEHTGSYHECRIESNTIERMNSEKILHQDDFKTFNQIFMIELQGILDAHKPIFLEILKDIYEKEIGLKASGVEQCQDHLMRMTADLIYHSFDQKKIKTDELSTLRVSTNLHAGMRWDRKRKYKPNDLADLQHASMAIPYCDLFLTEKSLTHLVNSKQFGIKDLYSCRTIAKAPEALDYLDELGI